MSSTDDSSQPEDEAEPSAVESSQPGRKSDQAPETLPKTGQLAYASLNTGHWSVWVHDFDTGKSSELANESDSDQFAPSYSHDGKRIAYISDQVDRVNQIWMMDADGSSQAQASSYSGAGQLVQVTWTSDDTQFIVTRKDGEDHQLLKMPVDGGKPVSYTDGWATFATTSATGSVAYIARDNAESRVVYAPEDDPGVSSETTYANTRSSDYAAFGSPNLDPEGDFLAFDAGVHGQRKIEIVKTGGGLLGGVPYSGFDDSNPVWSPDHSFLAYVIDRNGESEVVVVEVDRTEEVPGPLQIPDSDKVWYLSWRPVDE